MFYANFVLAKKGPLARVWLAAHWEKKLSKAHVFETDLQSSVDNIISPKVKIALRTSGHLLLGVVRIYSRKAKYLLADCTEALIKIKMAFRPDVVDLPLDNQKAAVSAITLPELQDWDQMVSELGTFDINTFNNNVCRVEDITMKEDLITSRYLSVTDDNFFGDTPFGEIGSDRENLRDDDMAEGREILRDGNAGGGSFVREENSVLGDINDENNSTKGDTTLINQSNLDLGMTDPMMGDGGFKAGEGLDFLEGFGIEGINDVPGITDIDGADPKLDQLDDTLVNKGDDSTALPELDAPKTPGGALEPMEPIDGIEDISAIPGPNQLPTYNENEEEEEMDSQPLDDEEVDEIGADLGETAAAIKAKIQSDNDAVFGIDQTEPEQDPFQEALKEPEVQEPEDPQETDFMTTLFSRDEEALNLEPIEVVDKKNKPKKRKRKLVVDQEKILVTEQIKAQIKCDEDIIKTAVVAPPTKARFVLLESSSCACFSQPPASIQTKRRRLNDIYNINMTLEKPDDLVLPSSQDEHEEVHLEKVPEVVQAEQVVEDPIEQIDHIEKINGVQEVLELPAALEAPIPEEVVEEPEKVLGEEEEEPRDEERRTHDIFQELVRNNDEIEKHIEMDEEMKEVEEELRNEEGINIAPAFELIREEKETDIELEDDGFQVMYEECEEEEEDEEEDPHFVDNNKRWTNRTHQTLKAVQKGLKRRQPIYFTDLTKKSTRKQAAYTFYTLLILSKEQAIDVQQSDLFGSISIDRGAKFQAHV